jgi:hypothetical protein
MTATKVRPMPGDPTMLKFGDREVEAVIEHVGNHGWVIARVVGDDPEIPYGYIAAKRI